MPNKYLWKDKIILTPYLYQKTQEFKKYGYYNVSVNDLWMYLTCFRWKREQPENRKTMKAHILAMTINDYFDYQQIDAQTSDSESFDWKNIEDLF